MVVQQWQEIMLLGCRLQDTLCNYLCTAQKQVYYATMLYPSRGPLRVCATCPIETTTACNSYSNFARKNGSERDESIR